METINTKNLLNYSFNEHKLSIIEIINEYNVGDISLYSLTKNNRLFYIGLTILIIVFSINIILYL